MPCAERNLLLVGGGGHCKSVLDAVIAGGGFAKVGVVDRQPTSIPGTCYAGRDEELPALLERGWNCAFVALGSIGRTDRRREIFYQLKALGYALPAVIDPTAAVSANARIAEGVFVGKQAIVNADAQIGACAIVNSGSIVEHDAQVGAFAHISPGAVLCGAVKVGEGAHVGANATVIQGITIGDEALVGAGSVVLRNVQPGMVAYGNPCYEVREK